MLRKPVAFLSALSLLLSACTDSTGDKDNPVPDTDQDTDVVDPDGLDAPVVAITPAGARTADDLVAQVATPVVDAVYTWAWTVNGANQADLRSDTVPESRTVKGDSWCVNVVVTKGTETAGPTQACVTIGNTPPDATVDLLPDLANSAEDLIALPTSTDVDGDAVTYTYEWEYVLDSVTVPYTAVDGNVSASALQKDQVWTVTVVPNDGTDDGEPATDSVTILNSAPVVLQASISPAAPTTDMTLTANVSAVDPDGDTGLRNTYTWFINGTGRPPTTVDTLSFATFSKGDEVWVEVVVTDGDTPSAPFKSDSVIIVDTAPTLDSVSMTPTLARKESTLTCVPSGWDDKDGDAEGYHYAWSVDGTAVVGASSSTLAGAFLKGQTVGCTAAPFDGELEGTPLTSNTVVISNTAPVIDSVALSSLAPGLSDTLSVRLTNPRDVDGDSPITYSYQWYVRSVAVPAPAGALPTLAGVFSPGDRVSVRVTPSDGTDVGVAVASNTAVVGNHKPTADSLVLTPVPFRTDDQLTATAAGSDVDGHTVTFRYRWRVNNVVVQDGLSNRLSGSFFVKGNAVEVNATPNDGYEDGFPRTAGPYTVANSPPVLGGVTLGPSPATETTTLTCGASAFFDADNDAPTYTYAWSVNSNAVAPTTSTLTGAHFSRGDDVRCVITPSDGTVTGSSLTSSAVTIANTKPTLASVTLTPATPRTGDTILSTPVGAADVDGDTVTFYTEWSVNGVVVSQGPTLAPSRFRPGDRIVARVSPMDGTQTGTSVLSNELVVANTSPTVTSFTLAPATPTTQDTLTTSLVTADLDGDTVTASYVWTVNGAVAAGATASTLPASTLKRDDVITVGVTVSDGRGGEATSSAGPVTVRNTAPVIASVVITPLVPTETSLLTCNVNGVADVDNDPTSYSVQWRVNGAVAGTASTLDGAAFRRGDGVVCVATATDGSASSPGVPSDPVIIANTAPTLASADISDAAPTAASLLVIDAGATADADGDSVSLEISWYVNDVFYSAGSGLLPGFARGDTIKAVVTPTDGITPGTPITTSTVTVLNSVPQVLSVAIGPSNPTQANTLVANVVSVDADGDALTFVYDWYVGATMVQSGPAGTLAPGSFVNGSVVHVVVTADDGLDTSDAEASGDITIGNAAPTITLVTITPTPVVETTTPTCVPTGWNDVDGDPEGYLYQWKINGVVRSVNPSINGLLFRRGDVLVCEVTPYDGKAIGTPVASAPVVVQNAAPTLVGVGLSNASPREGDTVSAFVAGVTDPDGDAVTTTITWFVDDVEVRVGPNVTGAFFDKGQTLRARVDLSDGTVTASFPTEVALVINTVPRVLALTVSPSTPSVLDAITASITTFDPDPADTIVVAWSWTIGGVVDATATTPTLPAGRARKHQEVFVSAIPSDGEAAGLKISSVPVEVLNSLPTLLDVAIDSPVRDGSGASCAASGAYDPDGDPVSVIYSWEVSGLPGPGGPQMDGFFYERGDVLVCRAVPVDGEALGPALVSDPETVVNARPTLAAVVLSDDPVRETSLLSAMLIGPSDADDDIVTPSYEWIVNGNVVSTNTLINGGLFSRGDTIQVRVQLSDGFEFSDPVLSAVAIVANSPPRIIGAPSIDPNPTLTNTTVTAFADRTDPDGDVTTLRYAWYVNGTLVKDGASATLAGSYFNRGDTVYAVVFPSDGALEGTGVQTYLGYVDNSRPSAPSVSISPSRPVPQVDPVVCSIVNPSVDPDGDPLSYVFSWTVDGTPSGGFTTVGTTSTLVATEVAASVLITCQAYATDGDLSSAASPSAITSSGAGILQDCKTLKAFGETTNGYYVVDDDGEAGSAPPYEVYCDQTFDRGGWERVIRTEGTNLNFGQDTYSIVSNYAAARTSQGVYQPFDTYRKWEDVLIRAVTGPQAGQYQVFKVYSTQLTMLEMLETCRDEAVQVNVDGAFAGTRTVGHTSHYTARSYGGALSVQRAAGGTPLLAEYFYLCGVNESSDNDVSYMAFSDAVADTNDWGDLWRGQGQIGTLWSFANGDYCCSGDHHIGNGAMESYAGWKGAVGTSAETWHSATYEIYLR